MQVEYQEVGSSQLPDIALVVANPPLGGVRDGGGAPHSLAVSPRSDHCDTLD